MHMCLFVCIYRELNTHMPTGAQMLFVSLNNALEELLFFSVTKLLSSLDSLSIK